MIKILNGLEINIYKIVEFCSTVAKTLFSLKLNIRQYFSDLNDKYNDKYT